MSITINGVVKNGVVVPMTFLPEGAQVEIRLSEFSDRESSCAGRSIDADRVAKDAA